MTFNNRAHVVLWREPNPLDCDGLPHFSSGDAMGEGFQVIRCGICRLEKEGTSAELEAHVNGHAHHMETWVFLASKAREALWKLREFEHLKCGGEHRHIEPNCPEDCPGQV